MTHSLQQLHHDLLRLWEFDKSINPYSPDDMFYSLSGVMAFKLCCILLMKLLVSYGVQNLPPLEDFPLWNHSHLSDEDLMLDELYEYNSDQCYPIEKLFESLGCNARISCNEEMMRLDPEIDLEVLFFWENILKDFDWLFPDKDSNDDEWEASGGGYGYLVCLERYEKTYQRALAEGSDAALLVSLCKEILEKSGVSYLSEIKGDWWFAFFFLWCDDDGSASSIFGFAQSVYFAVYCMNVLRQYYEVRDAV